MPDLYPLLLRPVFQERVWGARSLAPYYTCEITGDPIGEVWLTGESCTVANGPLAGRALGELSRAFGADLLGGSGTQRFPLLIKFLFPREKLSDQVHPDDEGAAQIGQACGKTECWYILRAEPGAQVGLGLKPGVTRAQVERAIAEVRLEPLLNWVDVHEGDMVYVDAGTVHAIGPGAVIVETQQNSDTTYLLYGYGRPRELHVAQGLQATRVRTRAGKVVRGAEESAGVKSQVNLVSSPHFVVDKFKLDQPWEFRRPHHAPPSVWCLAAIGGWGGETGRGGWPQVFNPWEASFIPPPTPPLKMPPHRMLEIPSPTDPPHALPPPPPCSPRSP